MEITIREASKEDARSIIELSKVLGAETDHLSFGAEGLSVSVEKEASYINSIANSQKNIFLLAFLDNELVGNATFTVFYKKRMTHRGEIGIGIKKSAWGLGIGSMLMEKLLDFAFNKAHTEIISLEVRSDNKRAIHLYEKYGFQKVGCFKGYFKINGAFIDFDIMEKIF